MSLGKNSDQVGNSGKAFGLMTVDGKAKDLPLG